MFFFENLLKKFKIVFLFFVIALLTSFFGGLVYEINFNPDFASSVAMKGEKERTQKNISKIIINESDKNEINPRSYDQELDNLRKKSSYLLFFVIIFWAWIIKEDLIYFYKKIEKKFGS